MGNSSELFGMGQEQDGEQSLVDFHSFTDFLFTRNVGRQVCVGVLGTDHSQKVQETPNTEVCAR